MRQRRIVKASARLAPSPSRDLVSQSASSSASAPSSDIFHCFICMSSMKKAVMCPSCSKMGCEGCMKKWITEQKRECPHCRASLYASQLVQCRFMDELQAQIKLLTSKKGDVRDVCDRHKASLKYYCETCSVPICSDCAMFDEKHKGHSFVHLKVTHGKHVQTLTWQSASLKARQETFEAAVASIQSNILAVHDARKKAESELRFVADQAYQKIEEQMRKKLTVLAGQRTQLSIYIKQLQAANGKIADVLAGGSQVAVIKQSADLVQQCSKLDGCPEKVGNLEAVSLLFSSEIVPQYESVAITLTGFSEHEKQDKVFFSDKVTVAGLAWRLKIYPAGNGPAKKTYLSVFVELLDGLEGAAEYQYRLQLINRRYQDSQEHNVIREFSSEFEVGECWGYNKFFPLDMLKTEGFLDGDDALEVRFHVRPLTYHQKSQDLQRYIATLSQESSSKDERIRALELEIAQLRGVQDEEVNAKAVVRSHSTPANLDAADNPNTNIASCSGSPKSSPAKGKGKDQSMTRSISAPALASSKSEPATSKSAESSTVPKSSPRRAAASKVLPPPFLAASTLAAERECSAPASSSAKPTGGDGNDASLSVMYERLAAIHTSLLDVTQASARPAEPVSDARRTRPPAAGSSTYNGFNEWWRTITHPSAAPDFRAAFSSPTGRPAAASAAPDASAPTVQSSWPLSRHTSPRAAVEVRRDPEIVRSGLWLSGDDDIDMYAESDNDDEEEEEEAHENSRGHGETDDDDDDEEDESPLSFPISSLGRFVGHVQDDDDDDDEEEEQEEDDEDEEGEQQHISSVVRDAVRRRRQGQAAAGRFNSRSDWSTPALFEDAEEDSDDAAALSVPTLLGLTAGLSRFSADEWLLRTTPEEEEAVDEEERHIPGAYDSEALRDLYENEIDYTAYDVYADDHHEFNAYNGWVNDDDNDYDPYDMDVDPFEY
ncbi:Tripartite motif containing 37 [Sorochytrium milnesiophthora]